MSQLNLFESGAADTAANQSAAPRNGTQRDSFGACTKCRKLICRCPGSTYRANQLARRSDPEASIVAAKEVEVMLAKHQATVWCAIQMMVNPKSEDIVCCRTEGGDSVDIELGDGSYTAREIAVFAKEELDPSTSIETLRKRVAELTKNARHEIVRATVPQICRITGKSAMGFTVNRQVKPNIKNADGS